MAKAGGDYNISLLKVAHDKKQLTKCLQNKRRQSWKTAAPSARSSQRTIFNYLENVVVGAQKGGQENKNKSTSSPDIFGVKPAGMLMLLQDDEKASTPTKQIGLKCRDADVIVLLMSINFVVWVSKVLGPFNWENNQQRRKIIMASKAASIFLIIWAEESSSSTTSRYIPYRIFLVHVITQTVEEAAAATAAAGPHFLPAQKPSVRRRKDQQKCQITAQNPSIQNFRWCIRRWCMKCSTKTPIFIIYRRASSKLN